MLCIADKLTVVSGCVMETNSPDLPDNAESDKADSDTTPSNRVTIRDVAKAVGVSPSTVSRAFARPGRVSAETSRKIREAADRLGYRSTQIETVEMTGGNTLNGLIAITVADLSNPIFADYVKSAQHAALRKGFGLLVIDFEETSIIERKALQLTMHHIDGLILTSSRSSDTTIRKLAELKPIVALNRPIRGVRSIVPDAQTGLDQALETLSSLGHTSFTYLSGPETSWQEGRRWRILSELSVRYHMKIHRITSSAPNYVGGFQYCEEFLKNPTTAAIAYNDMIAIGFMKALQAKGVRVPEDISIIGIDDTPMSAMISPPLSTVRIPRREPAELAVDEIIGLARHTKILESTTVPTFLPSQFVKRASVGQASISSLWFGR